MQNTPASCNLPVSHPEIPALAGQILSGRKSEQTNAAGITPSDTDSGIGSRFLLQQSGLQQCNWIKTSLLVLHIARRIWLCGGQQQPPLFEFQYCLGCLCSAKGTWFPNRNLGIFSPKKNNKPTPSSTKCYCDSSGSGTTSATDLCTQISATFSQRETIPSKQMHLHKYLRVLKTNADHTQHVSNTSMSCVLSMRASEQVPSSKWLLVILPKPSLQGDGRHSFKALLGHGNMVRTLGTNWGWWVSAPAWQSLLLPLLCERSFSCFLGKGKGHKHLGST